MRAQPVISDKPVVTYYLEMHSPAELRGKDDSRGLMVTECRIKQHEFNRFLYRYVGKPWQWTDKLQWSDERWREFVGSDNTRTWVAYYDGAVAGYFELQRQDDEVEILYFGLAEPFIGRGFGGYLLSEAIREAWAWQGTRRVWVHTCTLDHPSALQNYLARGMSIYKRT